MKSMCCADLLERIGGTDWDSQATECAMLGVLLRRGDSAGQAGGNAELRESRHKALMSVALAIAFAAIAVKARFLGPDVACSKLGFVIMPYTLLLTIWVCTRGYWETSRLTRWLQVVSKHSYAIYLSHATLLIAARKAMQALGLSGYGFGYLVVNCVVVTVGLALLIGGYQIIVRSARAFWRTRICPPTS